MNASYLEKFILSNVCINAIEGAWWGFCSVEDYNKLESSYPNLGSERSVSFFPLKEDSGVLITVKPDYVLGIINKLGGVRLSNKDIDEANILNMGGVLAFRLFLGKNKKYKGFIGVNEVTDSVNVSVSQTLYPSFKIDFRDVIHEFEDLNVLYLDRNNKWVRFKPGINENDFAESFTMSPTRNCMVLPVKIG